VFVWAQDFRCERGSQCFICDRCPFSALVAAEQIQTPTLKGMRWSSRKWGTVSDPLDLAVTPCVLRSCASGGEVK